jgi:hypothetical protein
MAARCPTARVESPAALSGHRLAFCGWSRRWEGGVATIVPAPEQRVAGLLYRMTPADVAALDGFEHHPTVYERIAVVVLAPDGGRLAAFTYRKRDHAPCPPSLRYLHQIWRAYRDLSLDDAGLLRALEEALAARPGNGPPARGPGPG